MPPFNSAPQSLLGVNHFQDMEFNVHKTATFLSNDTNLLKDWHRLATALGITAATLLQTEDQFKLGIISPYRLLTDLLERWKQSNGKQATMDLLCSILQDNKFSSAAALLNTSEKRTPQKINYGFKQARTKNFSGRKQELEMPQTAYESDTDLLVTITGLGGIGKSTLAREFLLNLAKDSTTNCIWLNGDTSEHLNQSLYGLAKLFDPQITDKSPTFDLFQTILATFTEHSAPFVIIIDNLDNYSSEVMSVLELMESTAKANIFFVVTSRDNKVLESSGTQIQLNEWSREDSFSFMYKSLNRMNLEETNNKEELDKLCRLLQDFPLALQQAAAFINLQRKEGMMGNSYGISNYLEAWEERYEILLSYSLDRIEHDYKLSTLTTWDVTIHTISRAYGQTGKMALDLLNLMAYLDPDDIEAWFLEYFANRIYGNGFADFKNMESRHLQRLKAKGGRQNSVSELEIPHKYFTDDCQDFDQYLKSCRWVVENDDGNPIYPRYRNFIQALLLLKRYSLIQIDNNIISIHRLVQAVTKVRFLQFGLDQCDCIDYKVEKELLLKFLIIIEDVIMFRKYSLKSHPHLNLHTHVIANYAFKKYDDLIIEFSEVLRRISKAIRYSQVNQFLQIGLPKLNKLFEEKDSLIKEIEKHLISVCHSKPDYKAELRICLNRFDRYDGRENEPKIGKNSVKAAKLVASVYESLNDDNESLNWWKKHLNLTKGYYRGDIVHNERVEIILALEKVRDFMEKLKKWEEVVNIYDELIKHCTKLYGIGNEESADVAMRFAMAFEQLQKYEKALIWWENRLQMKKRCLYKDELGISKAEKDIRKCRRIITDRNESRRIIEERNKPKEVYEGVDLIVFYLRKAFCCGSGGWNLPINW